MSVACRSTARSTMECPPCAAPCARAMAEDRTRTAKRPLAPKRAFQTSSPRSARGHRNCHDGPSPRASHDVAPVLQEHNARGTLQAIGIIFVQATAAYYCVQFVYVVEPVPVAGPV